MFINNKLIIIANNCKFIDRTQEDVIRILFDEEIKQVIVRNEEIAATDASTKYGHVTGV